MLEEVNGEKKEGVGLKGHWDCDRRSRFKH